MPLRTNPLGRINDLAIRRHEVEIQLIDAIVSARREGATWADVADMLGVSKQAAHHRYAESVALVYDKPERSPIAASKSTQVAPSKGRKAGANG